MVQVKKQDGLRRYFPINEVAFMLLSITLQTLLIAFNFLYGKKKINEYLFLPMVMLAHIILSALLIRSIYGRLTSTSIARKTSDTLDSLLNDGKETQGNLPCKQGEKTDLVHNSQQSKDDKRIKLIISMIMVMQTSSIIISSLAPFLWKSSKINVTVYFSFIITAYALNAAITTIFTVSRVYDRKVKKNNHEKILLLGENNCASKQISNELSISNKLEIGGNFLIDALTRTSDISINFLYAAKKINNTVYFTVISITQIIGFLLLLYATYDRFRGLNLIEGDKEYLEKQKNKSTNTKVFISIVAVSQVVSIATKITVPFFYAQDKLNTISYFALIFLSLICSSSISFILSINRVLDQEIMTDINCSVLTKLNHHEK